MAIFDTMELIPNDVATVTFGMAASMGQFLLTSGTKGKRYATNSSRILMHQPLGGQRIAHRSKPRKDSCRLRSR